MSSKPREERASKKRQRSITPNATENYERLKNKKGLTASGQSASPKKDRLFWAKGQKWESINEVIKDNSF